jgi:polyisoprenoid-binding protein YceI
MFKKLLAGIFTMGFASFVMANASFKADPAASQIRWLGKKVTGQHDGTIGLKSGELKIADNNISGGKFEIDMNSMTCTDIKDPKTNGDLLGHLKSDDFFGTAKFPTATFEIKSSKALPKPDAQGNTHEITGDLTIKGVTKPNTFPAKVEIKGNNVVAMGTVKVDRTAYGVKYNSGKFFPNIGDKMINDEFTIDLKIAAVAPAAKK